MVSFTRGSLSTTFWAKGERRALSRTVNADERVHVERDDSQRVEPGLEDHGEDDVEEHRKLKLWASRESGQRLSD